MSIFDWMFGKKNDALYNATHDKRTGLYNDSGFNMLYRDIDKAHCAIIVLELMNYQNMQFKTIEKAMIKLAEVVKGEFRSTDYFCRISTVDIAIVMTRMDSSKKDVVSEKVGHLFEKMKPDHLCVGVAFGDRDNPKGDLFLGAMSSLNHARVNGQDTFVMF